MKNPPIDISSHSPGTTRGEEFTWRGETEPGREGDTPTARSSTSINPKARDPIDPRMPHLPPT